MAHLEWDSQTCAQCSCYECAQSSLEYSPSVELARHQSEMCKLGARTTVS